jgi:hypothetical protein
LYAQWFLRLFYNRENRVFGFEAYCFQPERLFGDVQPLFAIVRIVQEIGAAVRAAVIEFCFVLE